MKVILIKGYSSLIILAILTPLVLPQHLIGPIQLYKPYLIHNLKLRELGRGLHPVLPALLVFILPLFTPLVLPLFYPRHIPIPILPLSFTQLLGVLPLLSILPIPHKIQSAVVVGEPIEQFLDVRVALGAYEV